MSRVKRCVACGHRASDHDEGFIGASMWVGRGGEQPMCHVDDHSCYVPTAEARTTPFDLNAPTT